MSGVGETPGTPESCQLTRALVDSFRVSPTLNGHARTHEGGVQFGSGVVDLR